MERAIRYLRENSRPARSLPGLDDLNAQVRAWYAGVAEQRVPGTTGRRPAEMQAKERLADRQGKGVGAMNEGARAKRPWEVLPTRIR